jgi:hypothetical protein
MQQWHSTQQGGGGDDEESAAVPSDAFHSIQPHMFLD